MCRLIVLLAPAMQPEAVEDMLLPHVVALCQVVLAGASAPQHLTNFLRGCWGQINIFWPQQLSACAQLWQWECWASLIPRLLKQGLSKM